MSGEARRTLAVMLVQIETADREKDYTRRYHFVLQAMVMALHCGFVAGIGFDEKEGPEWPVIYIELPGIGQLSWHMPAHPIEWDGHTTEEKYNRIRQYAEKVGAPIARPYAAVVPPPD